MSGIALSVAAFLVVAADFGDSAWPAFNPLWNRDVLRYAVPCCCAGEGRDRNTTATS